MRGAYEVKDSAHFAIALRSSRARGELWIILLSVTAMLFMHASVTPDPRWQTDLFSPLISYTISRVEWRMAVDAA
jgi:hypothetical protein